MEDTDEGEVTMQCMATGVHVSQEHQSQIAERKEDCGQLARRFAQVHFVRLATPRCNTGTWLFHLGDHRL